MFQLRLIVELALLAVIGVFVPATSIAQATASAVPTLFIFNDGKPQMLAGGAQKAWPVSIRAAGAFDAIFEGGMWVPSPDGGRVYARYAHHLIHANGDLTWVGKVQTARGEESAIFTFGKEAVFGMIPQPRGFPLRILTRQGRTFVVQTAATALANRSQLTRAADFAIPPRHGARTDEREAAPAMQASSASSSPVVDVMIAYTPGFVSEYGSVSAALSRINYVVDVANQAYTDSKIKMQIRLVHTVEVNYPDDTYGPDAVSDLTGVSITTGQPVAIPASLAQIHTLRIKYGADVVSMIRKYNDATNGYCGFAWIIGADQQPIDPTSDNAYGYSVVGDGSDNGYYCYDQGLAHELGHNMGSVHDRAHPSLDSHGNPISGAYPYSYGYAQGTTPGFFTVMAYGSRNQVPAGVFSNPNISVCQNQPCGTSDTSSQPSDNARSLNNTAPLISQFEPKGLTHDDINDDGDTDILFFNPSSSALVYWIMNAQRFVSYQGFNVPGGYTPVGTCDLDGNGMADILWNGNGTLYVWLNNGAGGFTSAAISAYPGGWQLMGCRDVDGDGQDDILWYHPGLHQFVYWIMSGAQLILQHEVDVTPGFVAVGAGDFNGDGLADIAWRDAAGHVYIWVGNGSGFTQYQANVSADLSWSAAGIGDVNGDGDSDIFWYQPSSGNVQYWLMNGPSVIGYKNFNTGQGYTFAGVGDFDGDGRADILWTRNNVLSMWLHYDPYNYYGVTVQSYATGWKVLP